MTTSTFVDAESLAMKEMIKSDEHNVFDHEDNNMSTHSDYEHSTLLSEKQPSETFDEESQQPAKTPSRLFLWIGINITATTAIVFINKSIFDDPSFRSAQLSFAAFHFFVTFATLHTVSSAKFGFFERKRAALRHVLPLACAMCLNVVLPNLSLAFSSVTFYQTARVLLTPITAFLDYVFYKRTIPRQAVLALIPVCGGVAMVTYFDIRPGSSTSKGTNFWGVFFALSGVLVSGVYTCWVSHYHQKLQMTSLQLLHNQSVLGAIMLLCLIPFLDTLPVFRDVPWSRWVMILMSGLCACLLNLSQFAIIAGAGPVASTVVGHSKTVTIVTLGWIWSGGAVSGYSILGVMTAISGIMIYSAATTVYRK